MAVWINETRDHQFLTQLSSVLKNLEQPHANLHNSVKEIDDLVAHFTIRSEKFPIGEVKAAHFNWKMKLSSVMAGHQHINENEIPDHHQCAFGKWYDNAPAELRNAPAFSEIGIRHEAVHKKVREAVALQNQNNISGAHKKIDEFEDERKQLFAYLDELYAG